MLTLNIYWTTPSLYKNNKCHIPIDLICSSYSPKSLETSNLIRKHHISNKYIYVLPYINISSNPIENIDIDIDIDIDNTKILLLDCQKYKTQSTLLRSFELHVLPFIKKLLWVNKNDRKKFNTLNLNIDRVYNIIIVTDIIFLHEQFKASRLNSMIKQTYQYHSFLTECPFLTTKPEWTRMSKTDLYKIFL